MTLDERQLAVGIVLSITLVVRALAQQQAGGLFRDQSDGLARERGWFLAVLMRLGALVAFVAIGAWLGFDVRLPGSIDVPPLAAWSGLVLAEAGAVLLIWVQLALGVHLSGTLHLRKDHQLVQSGPYATVRHPMYTAFILLFTGLALLIGNVPVAVLMLATQAWTVLWRLPAEERSLEERFGSAWSDYRRRTGALTPWW